MFEPIAMRQKVKKKKFKVQNNTIAEYHYSGIQLLRNNTIAELLYCGITILRNYYIAELLYCGITILRNYYIAELLYCGITILRNYYISEFLFSPQENFNNDQFQRPVRPSKLKQPEDFGSRTRSNSRTRQKLGSQVN
jgi:hypothetical protein